VRELRSHEVTRYLNVDLDIVAKADLSPLLRRFGESVVVLRDTVERKVHTLSLELFRRALPAVGGCSGQRGQDLRSRGHHGVRTEARTTQARVTSM